MPVDRLDFSYLFRVRRDYCRALLELSRGQDVLIETDDYTQLLVILGQKQGILGRMEELNRGQPQLWETWRAQRGQLDPGARALCETLLGETEAVLAELHDQEQASTERLAQRRNATRLELTTLTQGVRAHDAYAHVGSAGADSGYRLDIGQ